MSLEASEPKDPKQENQDWLWLPMFETIEG